MISYLKGTVLHTSEEAVIVEVNDIGYEVFIPSPKIATCKPGNSITVYTTLIVGERDIRLFGFPTMEERQMFEALRSVSGIGPKSALGVLSATTPTQIIEAISHDDVSLFTRVPGIGRKNASRIIIELKSTFSKDGEADLKNLVLKHTDANDVISALIKLGYKRSEIEPVLSKIDSELTTENKIREVLKRV